MPRPERPITYHRPGDDSSTHSPRRARLACARLALSADDLGLAGAQLSRLAGDSEASQLAADVEARRAALERERTAAARLRFIVRALALLLLVGLGTGAGVFYKRRNDVEQSRNAANSAEQKARSAADAAKSERERADAARRLAETAAAHPGTDWVMVDCQKPESRSLVEKYNVGPIPHFAFLDESKTLRRTETGESGARRADSVLRALEGSSS